MIAKLADKKKISVKDLELITLAHGAHNSRSEGVCAMEAAAWLAGREHTDHPQCVSPVIGGFVRYWNDALPTDEDRNRLLKPLLPIILETKTSSKAEVERAWMAIDWLARTHTPAFFDLTPALAPHAHALRKLEPFTEATAEQNQKTLDEARKAANAARDAAWAAAGAAAWAAARDAAWAAARDAARDAAWDAARAAAGAAAWAAAWDAAWAAAGAAARDAAWAAAGAAAWAAARDAARDAAGAAAWAAARDAAWAAAGAAAGAAARDAARDAARNAAGAKLAPTILALQESAQELVRRMAAVQD
jgi:hypothetical protein